MTKEQYKDIKRYYDYIKTYSDRCPSDDMIVILVEELHSCFNYILEIEKIIGIDKYLEELKGLEK